MSGQDPKALARFGKYDLLRELGRGGMGVVYEARDRELARVVALKLMLGRREKPKVDQEEERFVREARLVAAMPPHPGVVGVFEAGVVDGRRFIAMECIQGEPFTAWREKASLRQQIEVLRDTALALQHAHSHGIIHRDLKPDNILVDASGKPHLTDFGLAKAIGEDTQISLTAEGMVVGTPAYMSPEQAQGLRTVDGRTDVWALGVLLYEALTGRQPFIGQTAVEILMKASKNAAPAPSRIVSKEALPSFDPALENVCLKALSKKPADRFTTAGGFAADLDRWLKGRPVLAPPTTVRVKVVPKRPNYAVWITGGAALVAAAVGIGLSLQSTPTPLAAPPPKPPAPMAAAVPKPPPPPPTPAPAGRSLLPGVDPAADSIHGTWRREGAALVSPPEGLAVFSLPGEPPAEYDLRVEFTPMGAEPDINLIGLSEGRAFQWYVGSQKSTWYGFGWIDGDTGFGHPSGTRMPGLMQTGKRHTTLLEVRKAHITGWLDGRKLATLLTSGHTLGISEELLPRNRGRLGLVSWNNSTIFHAVELVPR